MAAIISGSTLSMLFYDHSSMLGNQEGLLTGKVISHVTDTISDSQINNVEVETRIYIYGCACQSRFESFHDNKGNIRNIDKSAVGWYRYRHNTSHRMSMKEKSLHQSLLRNVPPDKHDNFIFILCTSQKTENISTCNFDFTVFKYDTREKKYMVVPVTVINLGDTTHTEYKCTKSCTVDYDSGAIGSLLSSFEHELLGGSKNSEAAGVQKMAESLQTQLQCLTQGVMQSDHEIYTLHTELEQLELQLQKKTEKKYAKKPLPPSPTSPECMNGLPSTSKGKMSNEEAVARMKREQRRKEQHKSLYPNLSGLKVASSGSRTRRLSEDNYLSDINDLKASSVHGQIEKCHLLDSPIEKIDENVTAHSNLSCKMSEGIVSKHDVNDKHNDIPFADSEGFDPVNVKTVNKTPSVKTETKNKDPFAFVEGMIANSKNESDATKKKVNLDSNEVKILKTEPPDTGRVTRSRNNQADKIITSVQSSRQSNPKFAQNRKDQHSKSREKEASKMVNNLQNNKHLAVTDQNTTGSDEDIFDTNSEEKDKNHVVDLSSSPVF